MSVKNDWPEGKYGAILCDAPWNFKTYSDKGKGRSAEKHYETMSWRDLLDLPVRDLAKTDCVLFMWATDPMLVNALNLMYEWGFIYKTVAFTWVKSNKNARWGADSAYFTGMGYWTRSNPEMCLLGTKGHPRRLAKDVRQLIVSSRREHSRKPDEIHDRIEALVGGPYLELFARSQTKGWDVWGDETEKFV